MAAFGPHAATLQGDMPNYTDINPVGPCLPERELASVFPYFRSGRRAHFGFGVFVFRDEPEADGDLRAVEELAGEGDHAVHEVSLNEFLLDVALASQALRVGGPVLTCGCLPKAATRLMPI